MNGLVTMVGQAATDDGGLTTAGAVVMTCSILLVLGLVLFCMSRILREKHPAEHHHAPLDIDKQDLDS